MSEILIGRVGEDLHSFNLDDIKKGAVRDSGHFPELFQTELSPMVAGALISGVDRKLEEHRLALEPFDFPIHLPPSLLPRALEDSKEEQKNQVDIAKSKLERGFLNPVFGYAATLSEEEKQKFFQEIATRAQTDNFEHLITIADDRGLRMDPIFLEPLYGHFREHSNEQILDVFEEGHEVPGKRVKEIDGANLGIVNSIYLFHRVCGELSEQGTSFDRYQYMDTTLCFVPTFKGKLPLPEQGLIIKAKGAPRVVRKVTSHDMLDIAKGRILTYDHFDKPVGFGFSDWVTIHNLKRSISNDQVKKEEVAYSGIDKEQAALYLREKHSPGAAMSAFAYAMNVPLKGGAESSRPSYISSKKPKTVLTTGSFLGVDLEYLKEAFPVNSGKRVSKSKAPLTLKNLERACYTAQAFAVVDPKRYPITNKDIKDFGDKKKAMLVRQLKTSLIASYLITMSTQAGATQHIGRPHLVDYDWYKEFGLYHPDFANMGLVGDTEKEAYELYRDKKEINEGLEHFDTTTYQHDVKPPKHEFLNSQEVKRIVGNNLGYVVSAYGSATGFADETYRFPKQLTYELSKLSGVTTVDGGGVRSAMKGMKDGVIQAIEEGYSVKNIGIRSETDVSPLEGNNADYFEEKGFPLEDGLMKDHFIAAEGQMHVLSRQRILARQAAIAEISHASVIGDGGKGTVLEFYITATHNALVNLTGQGLLSHNRLMPLVMLNRDIEIPGTKRGIFDVLLEPWLDQAHIIGLKNFKGHNPVPEALQFLKDHAQGHEKLYGQKKACNFEIALQQPVTKFDHSI